MLVLYFSTILKWIIVRFGVFVVVIVWKINDNRFSIFVINEFLISIVSNQFVFLGIKCCLFSPSKYVSWSRTRTTSGITKKAC